MFLVENLRQAVDAWRDQQYAGISPVTRRLFQYWFEEDHLLPDGGFWRYWWAQRAAIDTETAWGRRDFALILFLMRSGRRMDEILSLRWGDFEVRKVGARQYGERWRERCLNSEHTRNQIRMYARWTGLDEDASCTTPPYSACRRRAAALKILDVVGLACMRLVRLVEAERSLENYDPQVEHKRVEQLQAGQVGCGLNSKKGCHGAARRRADGMP